MEDVATIGQIMVPVQDVIDQNEDVRMARRRLQSESKRFLIVVDGDAPVGVLEWRKIMHVDNATNASPVNQVMSRAYPELTAETTIDAASDRLADVDVGTIPVVDGDGRLIGEVARSAISHHEDVVDEAEVPKAARSAVRTETRTEFDSLAKSMTVAGASGSKIGEIGDVVVGASGQLEAINVSYGIFGRKHKRVTADLISSVDEDRVSLVIDQPEFKALPDLERAEEQV